MKHSLAKTNFWLSHTATVVVLFLAGIATSALASSWGPGSGPWNNGNGRNWNLHSPKSNDFFTWGTGDSNNPWDKWGPWNQRQQYPWEEGWWDKLPWSGNRPWDRSDLHMPWSKKKARHERRSDYLEYLRDARKERLERKLRYSRPPYPPPYGYGYPPPRYLPPPTVQGAPAPARMAPAQPAQGTPGPLPRPAGGQPPGTQGATQ